MPAPALLEACKQFEMLMLRSLWPQSTLQQVSSDDAAGFGGQFSGSRAAIETLFSEVFARALEDAGGMGLGTELAHKLSVAQR